MPSYMKGEPVWIDKEKKVREAGLWKAKDGKGYIAEVSYIDPHTHQRVREMKRTHRLDLAREWRQTKKADALRGEVTRRKKRNVILFKDFADEYFKQWSLDRKASTVYGEKNRIDTILKPHFGSKPIHTITRKDIERFIALRRKQGRLRKRQDNPEVKGVSAASTNRELCRLKNMFKMAVAWGYIDSNPADGITQAKEPIEPADFLSKEEVNTLLDRCDGDVKPVFLLAVNTGMRWGELMSLTWRDVDFERGLITVWQAKNSETRHVPMNQAVRDALEAHRKQQAQEAGGIVPGVFVNADTGKPFNDLRRPLKRALKKAGVDRHIRFHDLRHTAASHLVMAGVDLRTVGKILGHKTAQITLRYAHLAPDHLKGAVERLDFNQAAGQERQGRAGNEKRDG